MKKLKILSLPLFFILMSFSQCENKKFDKKPPVTVTNSIFQEWTGGQPGSKGVLVTITVKKPATGIVFDSLYFNTKTAKLDTSKSNDEFTLSANFINSKLPPKDMILSSDPKEEFGNRPPSRPKEMPFNIGENEAVISYFKKGEKRYFIVKDLKKAKAIFYQ